MTFMPILLFMSIHLFSCYNVTYLYHHMPNASFEIIKIEEENIGKDKKCLQHNRNPCS